MGFSNLEFRGHSPQPALEVIGMAPTSLEHHQNFLLQRERARARCASAAQQWEVWHAAANPYDATLRARRYGVDVIAVSSFSTSIRSLHTPRYGADVA